MQNKLPNENNKGQILIITLLIILILSVVVLSTVVNLNRDVKEKTYNEIYEQNYSYAEAKLLKTVEFMNSYNKPITLATFTDDLQNEIDDPLTQTTGGTGVVTSKCDPMPGSGTTYNGYVCKVTEGDIATDISIEFTSQIKDLEMNKNDVLQLKLTRDDGTSYTGPVKLKWTGNVVWSISLIYKRVYNGQTYYEVIKDVYDVVSGNPTTSLSRFTPVTYDCYNETIAAGSNNFGISLDPNTIKDEFGNIIGANDTGSLYLRLRPLVLVGDTTSITLCGDPGQKFPMQFMDMKAQSYSQGEGSSSPTPLLSMKKPLNPAPPALFDYVYFSNGDN
jgi:hypothetical protein